MGYKKITLIVTIAIVFLIEIFLRIVGSSDTVFTYIWKIVISFNEDQYATTWKITLIILIMFLLIYILYLSFSLNSKRESFNRLEEKHKRMKKENAELGNINRITLAGEAERESRKKQIEQENVKNRKSYPSIPIGGSRDVNRDKDVSAQQIGKLSSDTIQGHVTAATLIEDPKRNSQRTTHPNLPVNTPIDENNIDFVIQKYNQVTNWNAESAFTEQYRCSWFDCQNSMARIQHSDVKPIFITDNDGSYMAVRLPDCIGYYVFPRFIKAYNEASHMPGAMKEVFESN